MKKHFIACLLLASLFFITVTSFAQELQPETKKEVIAKAVTDYFFLERENIHAQFNKDTYLTNEQIWFKGYVFHRKKNVPFFTTVNVYVNLLDDTGKILDTQLLYANIGTFSGKFNLTKNFSSGRYYLQFYTNWMNNFTEDESAVYEIKIINPTTGAGKVLAKADPAKLIIDLNPEGGSLINGTANVIGIAVSDCNHNPVDISTVDVVDTNGKVILNVQLNKLGFGHFNLPANKGLGYKVVATYNAIKHEQPLPDAQLKGVAIEAITNTLADKTVIVLRTNKLTQDFYSDKPLYLLIHKDDEAIVYDVNFKSNTEIKIVIPNADLSDGMNTLRLIDFDYNQLSERLIYNYPKTTVNTDLKLTTYTTTNNQLEGTTRYPNMNLSVSILPKNSMAVDATNDIYSSFLLLPYIQNQKKALGKYYFSTLTKIKAYELDLFLLNQKSKYSWNTIKTNPPKDNYTFDRGLSIKGFVQKTAGDTHNSKARFYSITSGIDTTTPVADDGSFIFNNIVIEDSTYVNFTLLNKNIKPKELFIAPQILNGGRKINKSYIPKPLCSSNEEIATVTETGTDIPVFPAESIMLDETVIEKKRLQYEKSFGNINLTGYKITDTDATYSHNVLQYIIRHGGFTVQQDNMSLDVHLYTHGQNSINAAQTEPIIYIDNVQVLDHNQLTRIQMTDVDEIYINAVALVPSVRNYNGIIKIYLKKAGSYTDGRKKTTTDIIIKKAFAHIVPFNNTNYASTATKGFENFGVVDWEPSLMTDENGVFKFTIPRTDQKTLQFIIEGFSADGKIISEIKTVTVH